MLPSILRAPGRPLDEAASALRGLAWTVSIPLGLPAVAILAAAAVYFPFVLSYEGLDALLGAFVWSVAIAAIGLALVVWTLIVLPLNTQYRRRLDGNVSGRAGLRATAGVAIAMAPLSWALLLVSFFANLPFQALAAGIGLSVASAWLLHFGLRLARAA